VGGVWYNPHLLQALGKTEKPTEWALNPDNLKDVIDGMYGVVNEYGTGVRARIPGIEVCGKTGTAQLASFDYLKAHNSGAEMKDNAWFVGFAPRSAPEIAVVAFYEHGGHGQFAAPIVRDVMKAYFDKKARLVAMEQEKARLTAMSNVGLPGLGQAPAASLPVRPASAAPVPVEAAVMETSAPARKQP